MIVRPSSPDSLSLRETFSLRNIRASCILVLSPVSSPKVCSLLTDFISVSRSTGRSSMPFARSHTWSPCLPKRSDSVFRSARARSPMVLMFILARLFPVFSPTPQSFDTGRAWRKDFSPFPVTMTRPSGFFMSEAIFAVILLGAIPTDAVSPVSFFMAVFMRRHVSSGEPKRCQLPVISMKASSILMGSISGVKVPRISRTRSEISEYLSILTGKKTACGHFLYAIEIGIAEWMPYLRAA